MDDEERIEIATGARPLGLDPVVGHGAPSHRRWRVTYEDRPSAFAKIAAFDYTADWLRTEHANYEALAGQQYLSPVLGWYDDGEHPALVLEDLSDAIWPPPWTTDRIDAVFDALSGIQGTPPPASIANEFGALFDIHEGWDPMRGDPSGALALGVFDRRWFETHADTLATAAASADLGGDALLHGDVRSDNLCVRNGRVVLVDWNWACRGASTLDVLSWLPSLHHEGGPEPWALMPDHGPYAALLAGFFLEHAGREPIPQAPHVRQLQLDQGVVALAWACRELGIQKPSGAWYCTCNTLLQSPAMAVAPSDYADVLDLLRSRGLRMTPQRRAIVSEVMRTKGHISPAAIARTIEGEMPGVNPSTVYRTLTLLEEVGVLQHSHLESGAEYHKAEEAQHVHLTCHRCGRDDELSIAEAERLGQLIHRHHGFEADLTHFAITGLCADCAAGR